VILGLGTDFLETRRVEQELSRGEWLSETGIFTPGEISYCSSARRPARRYAACFTAKEAALKALGVQVRDLALFREVEVEAVSDREHKLLLHDRLKAESERLGVRHVRLSIAYKADQVAAVVVLEA
jgi:holo-[acyl-carrier protein] synthase